jgi:hypothetical protein
VKVPGTDTASWWHVIQSMIDADKSVAGDDAALKIMLKDYAVMCVEEKKFTMSLFHSAIRGVKHSSLEEMQRHHCVSKVHDLEPPQVF